MAQVWLSFVHIAIVTCSSPSCELCRKQESPFFAKVLGVILQKEATDLDVHMVLETCSCTLEDWLHTPATSIEVRTAFGLSEQLCSALEVLHDSGYVHGELEPSTVMVRLAV